MPKKDTVAAQAAQELENKKKAAQAAQMKEAAKNVKAADASTLSKAAPDEKTAETTKDLQILERSLAITNESFFTKQSKQFKQFRSCVKVLNKMLEASAGNVANNIDGIASAIIAVEKAKLEYDAHCERHPSDDVTRQTRKFLVNDVMKKLDILNMYPEIKSQKEYISAHPVEEPIKNLHWLTGQTKEEFREELKKAEAEKAKKDAAKAAAKKAEVLPEKNLHYLFGMKDNAELENHLNKIAANNKEKAMKLVEDIKKQAEADLNAPEKNIDMAIHSIWAGEEELAARAKAKAAKTKKAIEAIDGPLLPDDEPAAKTSAKKPKQDEGPSMGL